MSIAIVHFLEAMQVKDDQCEVVRIAKGPIELFLKIVVKKTPVVEAGQWVCSCVDLELSKVFILHHNRQAQKTGRSQNIHYRCLQGYSLAGAFGEFALAGQNLLPDVQALRFVQVHMSDGLKKSLKKLPACRPLHCFERVGQQLEKGILGRQTGRIGATRLRHH